MKTILFVDGQNFKGKIKEVFENGGQGRPEWRTYDFLGLMNLVLRDITLDEKIFYAAKIVRHPETDKKSLQLIEEQRTLKTHLEKQGFSFVIAGRIRGQLTKDSKGKERLVFKEKGVDGRLAVDMVTMACDQRLKRAIIASSDSDIQPAIYELRKRNVETIYLGFETNVNKGLTYTTHRTMLIRDSEVLQFSKVGQLPL